MFRRPAKTDQLADVRQIVSNPKSERSRELSGHLGFFTTLVPNVKLADFSQVFVPLVHFECETAFCKLVTRLKLFQNMYNSIKTAPSPREIIGVDFMA